MLTFIARRFLIIIPMLLVISFLIYGGIELTPGDAVSYMMSPDAIAELSPEQLEQMRESLGLNDPFIIRYFSWLNDILHGEFGYSMSSGVPIKDIVFDRLPATLELSFIALILSSIFGSVIGMVSALKKGTWLDNVLTVVGMIGVSIPRFFFGLVAILVFSLHLEWLPVGGRMLPEHVTLLDRLPHLILPSLVLAFTLTAGVMRYSRASMLEALNKEYIKTARSKGVPEWKVNIIHGFRVALTPVIVLVGFRLPMLIGGTVVIEKVFQWPGIGTEFIDAIQTQNLPLVMMIAMFIVFAVLIASFLVDLFTAILDPRIKLD